MKLELRGITKRFGSLVANDHIDVVVQPGEIHALLGENGAGKSTLMNVLYGLYQADEGEILLDDAVQHFRGPGDAMAAGIGMVHQHFMLVPVFTVAENVMLGHEQTKALGSLDLAAARAHVRAVADRFGFEVDPDAIVGDRCAAARRDHQGALARRPGARVRRAHRGAHAAGDRRAHGDHETASG
jgi:simple sugar transport system ATP-binding protein